MIDLLTGLLVLTGGGFCFIAAIGMARFPDLYVRMHAATKAGTLGAGLALLAIIISFNDLSTILRAVTALLFLFLTAPIGAHLLARAAYASGVKMWDRSVHDDLKGRYDFVEGTLEGVDFSISQAADQQKAEEKAD